MADMPTSPAHAKSKDHLWVLAIIAACCLIKVWPSWVGIGAEAQFPKLGKMATDWTLAVVVEAYWAYAVYAWLAAPVGRRSGRFAMWSAAAVFALSLVGQSAAQVMAAAAVKVFANALPVIVLALIALLVHFRHLDRADAEAAEQARVRAERQAQEAATAADERAGLRATLAAQAEALEAAQAGRAAAVEEAAQARADRDSVQRKLNAANARNARSRAAQSRAAGPRRTAQVARADHLPDEVPEDISARAEALAILANEPGISGAQLGPRVGMSKRWGQELKRELAAAAPRGQDPEE